MDMKFTDFMAVGYNCPNFTGIKEHGPKMMLDLDFDFARELKVRAGDRSTLHIHGDGTAYITSLHYNYQNEEYEEELELDVSDDFRFKKELDNYLKQNPLYKSSFFPYTISQEELDGFRRNTCIADSYNSLLEFIKTI